MLVHHVIPAQEIEVIVAKEPPTPGVSTTAGESVGRARLRINGTHEWNQSQPMAIDYRALRQQYTVLEQRTVPGSGATSLSQQQLDGYEAGRDTLGRALGEALIGQFPPLEQALREALRARNEGEYVRLVLCFQDPELVDLPWELMCWQPNGEAGLIWLGRDERFALSRLAAQAPVYTRQTMHTGTRPLSVLNVVASHDLATEKAITHKWLEHIEDYLPMLHTVSRQSHELAALRHVTSLFGPPPEFHVVQWLSHGGQHLVSRMSASRPSHQVPVDALIQQVGGPGFVWLVLACYSGGHVPVDVYQPPSEPQASVHRALVEQGVPAVIGSYGLLRRSVIAESYMSALYASLIRGWPLDFAVQKLRTILFQNDEFGKPRHAPHQWSKPTLLVGSTWYLGGSRCRDPAHQDHEPVTVDGWLARWMAMERVRFEPDNDQFTVDRGWLKRELDYLGPIGEGPDPRARELLNELREQYAQLDRDTPRDTPAGGQLRVSHDIVEDYHKLIRRMSILQLTPNPL